MPREMRLCHRRASCALTEARKNCRDRKFRRLCGALRVAGFGASFLQGLETIRDE